MNLHEKLRKLLGNIESIKGFKVMEWLRGVRDANYELSIKDPEAYRRKRRAARRRIDILIREQKREPANKARKKHVPTPQRMKFY